MVTLLLLTVSIFCSCVVALFAVLVLVGTSIDYLNTWAPAKVLLSKSNGFMPAKLSTDEVIEDMHVNESQPFFAQEDVKGSKGNLFNFLAFCYSFSPLTFMSIQGKADLKRFVIDPIRILCFINSFW